MVSFLSSSEDRQGSDLSSRSARFRLRRGFGGLAGSTSWSDVERGAMRPHSCRKVRQKRAALTSWYKIEKNGIYFPPERREKRIVPKWEERRRVRRGMRRWRVAGDEWRAVAKGRKAGNPESRCFWIGSRATESGRTLGSAPTVEGRPAIQSGCGEQAASGEAPGDDRRRKAGAARRSSD